MTDPHAWPAHPDSTALVHQLIPIAAAMGIEVLQPPGPRTAAVRLPLAPNRNHVGTAYAGSLFTAAELLGGLVALSDLAVPGTVPLLRGMDIEYLAPATGDVVARVGLGADEVQRITAEATASGRSNFDLRAVVVLADGTEVARTVGRYQIRAV